VKSSEASIKIDESELKEGSQSENARKVANSVKKEEDFYLGIYESRDSQKVSLVFYFFLNLLFLIIITRNRQFLFAYSQF